MAVSEEDVRHVAQLARLGIDPARLPSLVSELNGILEHMEVLGAVETGHRMADVGSRTTATAMRSDTDGTSIPLARELESIAPELHDGFFLVPRLSTHEDLGERAP